MKRMGVTHKGRHYASLDAVPVEMPPTIEDWVRCRDCIDTGCTIGNYSGRVGGCRAGTRRVA